MLLFSCILCILLEVTVGVDKVFVANNNGVAEPYRINFIVDKKNESLPCQILSMSYVAKHRMLTNNRPIYVSSIPQSLSEEVGEKESDEHVVDVYAKTREIAESYFLERCSDWTFSTPEAGEDEVIPLIITGPPSNRIDVVFMGDGYTEGEVDQMESDIKRLVDDMFTGTTFAPYLPLFNIWIVFRPSVESGIGTGGVPKNTAFRLYRDGTELRGVYCANPAAARSACSLTGPNACDFPTLIGNSPFYGGLGGEFTISTSSETSGTIVLRHELGHNFGQVGEEYDGGSSYFGANFANSVANAENKWWEWLSQTPIDVQESQLRLQDYPWYLLENGPRSYTFSSNGAFDRWFLRFTASGCPEADSLRVILDGVALEWEGTGSEDRRFYSYYSTSGFSAGTHSLRFEQAFPPSGNFKRQLCSLTLHEYLDEPDFHWDEYYSAYRTWRQGGALAGYRPTNEYCLMRNMSSPHFCDICKETMWLQFFAKVSAIDNVTVTYNGPNVDVKLNAIGLAQFRSPQSSVTIPRESYVLKWSRNGVLVPSLDNVFEWSGVASQVSGTWIAYLDFITEEVRQDPNELLKFQETFVI